MPAQFTFYTDKFSEVVVDSRVSFGKTGVIVVSCNLFRSDTNDTVDGRLLITKSFTTDVDGTIVATFEYTAKFNEASGLPSAPFTDVLCFTTKLYNNITIPQNFNITEIIPPGQTSVQITCAIDQFLSTGEFCNQFGYVDIITNSNTIFKQYNVYFPLLVAQYTNAFNGLPQPSIAPLA